MKFTLLLVSAALFFCSSCVAVFNSKTTTVHVRSRAGARLVGDSTRFVVVHPRSHKLHVAAGEYDLSGRGASIVVARSRRELLPITVKNDSFQKTIYLQPVLSSVYYCNFLNYGIGYITDLFNPNRFSYKGNVYINMDDPKDSQYHRFAPIEKRSVSFNFSVPYANNFVINDGKNSISDWGFWGITAGANYSYARNRFLSTQLGVAVNIPIPVPAPVDRFGDSITTTNTIATFANVKNNIVLGRFDLGYGLSLNRIQRKKTETVHEHTAPNSVNHTTYTLFSYDNINIGGAFSAYYRVGNSIRFGLLYQPGILSITDKPAFKYQHFLSFDILWHLWL